MRADNDHRQLVFPHDLPQRLHAIHAWHLDIEDREIRR